MQLQNGDNMSLKNIRKKPEFIKGIGDIYPIEVKDYDDFQECANILYISKNHFQDGEKYPLLDLVIFGFKEEERKENISNLEKLFTLTLHKEVFFIMLENNTYGFIVNNREFDENSEVNVITNENYEQLRSVIMKQNIMHEQKVFKNPLVQQWANTVIESKAKNSVKISMEDMLTTVSVVKCKDYDELDNYSIYQVYADFYRIRKMKSYDSSVLFRTVSNDVKIEDFAEDLDLYHNPYDDLFVSNNKLNKFNKK
jgi:hypothetical protein